MSMFDWQSFFLEEPKTEPTRKVAWSIFDDPEEVEKAYEGQKEPAPSKDKKEPETKAPAQPDVDESKWNEFLSLFYEGGKKKVKNPNPQTNKKYPEVQADTAMKDPAFASKVKKEYEAWLAKGEDKSKSPAGPQAAKELVAFMENVGADPDFEKFQELAQALYGEHFSDHVHETLLKEMKKRLQDKGHDDAVEKVEARIKELFGPEEEPEEEEKPEPKELKVGDKIESTSDLQKGMFITNSGGTVGKITSLKDDGGFNYKEFHKLQNTLSNTVHQISKEEAEKFFKQHTFKVSGDPKDDLPEGADVSKGFDASVGDTVWMDGEPYKILKVEMDEEHFGNKFKLKGKSDWVNMTKVDKPYTGVNHHHLYLKKTDEGPYEKGDIVYHKGESAKVLETKKDSYGKYQVKIHDGSPPAYWINVDYVQQEPPTSQEKMGPVDVGEKVTKPEHLQEGDFIKSVADKEDPYYGKITEVHGDDHPLAGMGKGVYVQDYDPKNGTLKGEPWWLSAEELDDGETFKEGPKKIKVPLSGKSVKDIKKLKAGDVLRTHQYANGKLTTSIVTAVGDKGVHLDIMGPKSGKVLGSKFIPFEGWEDKYQLSRLPKSKTPKKLKEVSDYISKNPSKAEDEAKEKAKKEEEEEPKAKPKSEKPAKPGAKISKVSEVEPGQSFRWEKGGEVLYGTVQKKSGDEDAFYMLAVDEEGNPKKYLVFDDEDLEGLSLSRVDEESIPALKASKVPTEPKEPKLPEPPEIPKGKLVTDPSEIEVGDGLSWTFHGNDKPYRGEVVGKDEHGNPKIKLTWPVSSANHGKILDPFTPELLAKNKTKLVPKKEEAEYQKKVIEHENAVAESNAEYQKKYKAYQHALSLSKGKYKNPEHATTREKFANVKAPETWNVNSYLARKMDRLAKKYEKEYGPEIKETIKSAKAPNKAPGRHGSQSEWDKLSKNERKLWSITHSDTYSKKLHEILSKALTPQEKTRLNSVLSSWQGSSGGHGAHQMMGALEELGMAGGPAPGDGFAWKSNRETGSNDEVLRNAVTKAMAFGQAVYDSLGLDKITLYRGMTSNTLGNADIGQEITVPDAREFVSASPDPTTSNSFGAYRLKARVPVGHALLGPWAYPNLCCYSGSEKAEILMSDLPSITVKKMPSDASEDEEYFENLKMAAQGDLLVVSDYQTPPSWIRGAERKKMMYDDAFKTASQVRVARMLVELALQNSEFRAGLFGRPTRTASFTIFDEPEEVERSYKAQREKLFPAGEDVQKADNVDEGFETWFHEKYEGGKKKVKNPNPQTNKKYPEVQADTAMKDPAFASKVKKEYERQKGEPETTRKPQVIDVDEGDFEKVGPQAGSNPGGLYEGPDGDRYYVKATKDKDRARNEILAGKLYELAGVEVPELTPAKLNGKDGVASKIIPGLKSDEKALKSGKVKGAVEGMAVDAWLANWDVVGLVYDNLLVDDDGKAQRVDTGGALRYRAMGSPKGDAFGDEVSEFKFFFDPHSQSGSVFSNATREEVGESVDRVLGIPEDQIKKLVENWGPEDDEERERLLETLLSRQQWIKDNKEKIVKRGRKTASSKVVRAMSNKKDKPLVVSDKDTPAPWERGKRKPSRDPKKGPDEKTPSSGDSKTKRDGDGKFSKGAMDLLRLASQNSKFRGELIGELRRLNAPRDFAYDDESQEALLTQLQGGDLIEVTYDAISETPARSIVHTVAFDYDPGIRGVELAPQEEGGPRAFLADAGDGDGRLGVIYSPNPNSKGYPVMKLKVVRSVLRYEPHPPKIV